MSAHRATNIALTGATAVGIAAILLAGPVLDDHGDEWPQSTTLADAQRAARKARQAELDAIRQCTAMHGPGAAIGYTIHGDLVCGPRRGEGAVVIALKGASK